MQALEDSLQRLQMDYVDIYYIHHVDVQTPLDEMLRALDDLVHQGKVRYIACSNYEAWRLMEALWISDKYNLARFVCYQPQCSLVVRDIAQEIIPVCRLKGLGVVPWSPLAGGFLTGKYQPGERTRADTRSSEGWAYPSQYFASNADETLTLLLEIAEDLDRSPAQIALRWVLEQPLVTSVIIGARTVEQARDNLWSTDWRLPKDTLEKLNTISYLPPRYPASMEAGMAERRNSAVG